MKKKTLTMILSATMALSVLSGCGNKEEETTGGGNVGSLFENLTTERKDASEEVGSEKAKDGEEEGDKSGGDSKASDQISWAVEPFLSVDDIKVEDMTSDPRVNMVAVVKNKDKYGYIRYDGSYALEPFFDGRTPDDFGLYNDKEGDETIVGDITESGELSIVPQQVGWGGPGAFYYFYDLDTMSIYEEFGGSELYTGDRVEVVDQIKTMEGGAPYVSIKESESKFGIADTKGLITELKYEDGYCRTSDASPYVALKSGGKWGFFTINGKQLTDFVYEEFPDHGQDSGNFTRPKGTDFETPHNMPYLPTEGYIAVRQNGKCGYIDVEGKEIYPIGTFDDVRPVHGQKAWAKKDGKWGILEFAAGSDPKIEVKKEDYYKINDTAEALEAYADVVAEYKRGFEYLNAHGNTEGFESTYGFTAFMEEHQYDIQGHTPSYALYDINGDGTKELILKPVSSDGYGATYDDIFTLVNGKPSNLSVGHDYSRILGYGGEIVFCEGGHLLWYMYERYTEHSFMNVIIYKMSKDGTKWEEESSATADISGWPADPVYTYHDQTGKEITKEEYDAFFDKYKSVELKFVPLP